MLKVFFSALLLTGFCVCVEKYHDKANAKYKEAVDNNKPRLPIREISNREAPEYVKLYPGARMSANFMIQPDDPKDYLQVCTEDGLVFELFMISFRFQDSKITLSFRANDRHLPLKVTARLFEMPDPKEEQLYKDAKEQAFHVQLMTKETLNNLLNEPDQRKKERTIINTGWIKAYFERANPLIKRWESKLGVFRICTGMPITMDAEELSKLAELIPQLRYR